MSNGIEKLAARRVAERVGEIAEAAAEELPELAVERRADGVALGGRGLLRRFAFDTALRALALVLRRR